MAANSIFSFCVSLLIWPYTLVRYIHWWFTVSYHVHQLAVRQQSCQSYDEWSQLAKEMDALENKSSWADEHVSYIYDYRRVAFERQRFDALIAAKDVGSIMSRLRPRLIRNFVNMHDTKLVQVTRTGTKRLIEDYTESVISALQLISRDDTCDISLENRLAYLIESRHTYGKTALLLSGGATMAFYHTGVIRALYETHLLPRVVSGSSGGSIFASMLGTRTDAELDAWLNPEKHEIDLDFFPADNNIFLNILRRLQRFYTDDAVMDINVLKRCIRANIADYTFLEAYHRSGRVINITVTPAAAAGNMEKARLCNYLTTPDVLVWSATVASCAIPHIYSPVELFCKDKDGKIQPYIESVNPKHAVLWADGSVMNDLPMGKLSQLFNIDAYIVSQVNPHVAPVYNILSHNSLMLRPFITAVKLGALLVKSLICDTHAIGFPWPNDVMNVLQQTYTGDVTISPMLTITDFNELLKNPTVERYGTLNRHAAIHTYEKLHAITGLMKIELCLDECVRRVRAQVISNELAHQKQVLSLTKRQISNVHVDENWNSTDSEGETESDHVPLTSATTTDKRLTNGTTNGSNGGNKLSSLSRLSKGKQTDFKSVVNHILARRQELQGLKTLTTVHLPSA